MRNQPHVLAIVLAGGEGKRLFPLTADRAKPAVPFGGSYRLIDFVLSNLVNAGFMQICVLTQYKSHSLDRHIAQVWHMRGMGGEYVAPVPAQQRLGPRWYTGSADAILQSLNLVYDEKPDHIVVFGADHVYRMDPRQMLDHHISTGAAVTVAGIRVPRSEAFAFGCIDAGDDDLIRGWVEKPSDPPGTPDDPDATFASMGNYIFTTDALIEALKADAEKPDSTHDMGGDIIPALVEQERAYVYDFALNNVPGETERDAGYWRDVGTIDAFYDAHMDLVSVHPVFNLYNSLWPIRTQQDNLPPAKFVNGGMSQESMVGSGTIVSAAQLGVVEQRHRRGRGGRRGQCPHAGRPHRSRGRGPQGDRRQELPHRRRGPDRCGSRTRPQPVPGQRGRRGERRQEHHHLTAGLTSRPGG